MHSHFSIGCNATFVSPTSFDSTMSERIGSRPAPDSTDVPPNREPLRVLIIGSRRNVVGTIQTLYRLGFAEVGEWSPLLPAPSQGEVMSILTRYILSNHNS